jgi:hypothetical protein
VVGCGGETPDASSATRSVETPSHCPVSPHVISGVVEESAHVSRYTYIKLRREEGTVWAAVRRSDVEIGETVHIVHAIRMENFRSPATGRVFPRLFLGYLGSPHKTCSLTQSV